MFSHGKKNAGPLFEIDRKLVPYRPEKRRRRRRRHHHHRRSHRRSLAAVAALRVTIRIQIITIILLLGIYITKRRRHPRNKTHTIGRLGRSKKKKKKIYRTIYNII